MALQPDRYAVMGNPIAHSQSPLIHGLFAAQTGQNLEYQAILVEPGQFAAAADAFRAECGRGLNVTVPFKQDAWVYADILSARAERSGAVNTLVFREHGDVLGDNTDGLGLVRDLLDNYGLTLKNKRVLLLGAGGAARGVLTPLLKAEPSRLVIANRTPAKAVELALLFNGFGPVSGCGFGELSGFRFDLVINGTAASLSDTLLPLPADLLSEGGRCYDMMYGKEPTAFMRWGLTHGAVCAMDGIGMLVEQAAESFRLWRGVSPTTKDVIAQLRG
jgi:shikimate dehydrogenase